MLLVGLTEIAVVVSAVLHTYVPPPLAVSIVPLPLQIVVVPVMLGNGIELTVTAIVVVPIHPVLTAVKV